MVVSDVHSLHQVIDSAGVLIVWSSWRTSSPGHWHASLHSRKHSSCVCISFRCLILKLKFYVVFMNKNCFLKAVIVPVMLLTKINAPVSVLWCLSFRWSQIFNIMAVPNYSRFVNNTADATQRRYMRSYMREYREDMFQLFLFVACLIKEVPVHHMFNNLLEMLNLSSLLCSIMSHMSRFKVKMNQKLIIFVWFTCI